jgi:glycosidase
VILETRNIVRWLVQEFSVDGLRIDTLKHVRKTFWPDYEKAAGVWCTGEVLHGGGLLLPSASNGCRLTDLVPKIHRTLYHTRAVP